eukprot:3959085-Prymnesium_polylepis.1
MASKAEDMQELIRRIFRLEERHGFRVRGTHTPGEKLDQPDQTSRGTRPRSRGCGCGARCGGELCSAGALSMVSSAPSASTGS